MTISIYIKYVCIIINTDFFLFIDNIQIYGPFSPWYNSVVIIYYTKKKKWTCLTLLPSIKLKFLNDWYSLCNWHQTITFLAVDCLDNISLGRQCHGVAPLGKGLKIIPQFDPSLRRENRGGQNCSKAVGIYASI